MNLSTSEILAVFSSNFLRYLKATVLCDQSFKANSQKSVKLLDAEK